MLGHDLCQFFKILIHNPDADHDSGKDIVPLLPLDKGLPLSQAVVLVNRTEHPMFGERLGDLESPDRIHIGGDNRHTAPPHLAVQEDKGPVQFNQGPAFQGRAFRADQHVLETQFQVSFNTHKSLSFQ